MPSNSELKLQIINRVNAYYAKNRVAKTITDENWAKVTEPCTAEDARKAAEDICTNYQIPLPADPLGLISEGLDAVADYINSKIGDSPDLSEIFSAGKREFTDEPGGPIG
jgi:hypothetical protein